MSRRRIIPYRPELKALARRLRKGTTPAEKKLWHRLRRKQVHGLSFYRQRPIDRYVVDFFCPGLMLAIEVDGRSHDGRLEEDAHRQKRLERLGVRFLRFNDRDVLHDTENVIRAIEGWLRVHESDASP